MKMTYIPVLRKISTF